MRALSAGQKAKVEKALEQHQSFRPAWFWASPGNASGRRSMERRNNWAVGFRHEGVRYGYSSAVRCSTRHVYYLGRFWADGERVTVRRFKALVGQL